MPVHRLSVSRGGSSASRFTPPSTAYVAPFNLDVFTNETIAANPWLIVAVFVGLFLLEDLAYYCFHRGHHRIRFLWASHVVHHSSRYYNFTTALRQSWTPMTTLPFWLPLALLGFPPWMIFMQQSISLVYQFFLHTERIGRLPRPVEWVMNTPSHHRVHHGSNERYLDRNFGGILIVWDRLFGSFEGEGERVRYGLTANIDTYNPIRVAFGEYAALWRDMRQAPSVGDALRYLVNPPGWKAVPVVDVGRAGGEAVSVASGGMTAGTGRWCRRRVSPNRT